MSSFLNDARAKLQHNSKLSLAPRDLKNLAELIATEKNVVLSTSKTAVETRKAAEAMKEWGLGEGDDLTDILSKLSGLLHHLADAESKYSDHDATYRLHFKSVRMREEQLTTLKKSRDALGSKISSLEKKITKTSSENKELPAMTDRLKEFKAEMVSVEYSVATEEARLSDFKRDTVRDAMGLKLGALLEMAEKMTIISELGKLLIDEVPMDRADQGGLRAPYLSAEKTQSIVNEAYRCLTEVTFNPAPGTPRDVGNVLFPEPSPNLNTENSRSNLAPVEVNNVSLGVAEHGDFRSSLNNRSSLAYAMDDLPAVPPPDQPDPPRSYSPPPRLDFDPSTNHVAVSSPPADYDPIIVAAQRFRKDSVTGSFTQRPDVSYGKQSVVSRPDQAQGSPMQYMDSPHVPQSPMTHKLQTEFQVTNPASLKASGTTPGPAGRPPVIRGDSALGSRHGFDMDYAGSNGMNTSPVLPMNDYTSPKPFGFRNNETASQASRDAGGRMMKAGAFRRHQTSNSDNQYANSGLPGIQVSGYQGPPPGMGPTASESIASEYRGKVEDHSLPDGSPQVDEHGGLTSTSMSSPSIAPLRVTKRSSFAPESPSDETTAGVEDHHPPPPAYQTNLNHQAPKTTPTRTVTSNTGFSQNHYVTALD